LSLFDGGPRSASVVAAAPETRVTVIARQDLERVLEKNAAMAMKVYKSMLKKVSQRLREANEVMRSLLGHFRRAHF
jgi:CRP-like cAMP-binding protein